MTHPPTYRARPQATLRDPVTYIRLCSQVGLRPCRLQAVHR